MRNQQYDLRLTIACYILDDGRTVIPPCYLDRIVKAYKQRGLPWNTEQAAAFTLFSASCDGVLQLSELTVAGRKALQWAEQNHAEHGFHETAAIDVELTD